MSPRGKHLVITVHGIRTFGQWQQRLERLFSPLSEDLEFYHFQYGYFSMVAFVIPFTRWLLVRRFRRELRAVVARKQPVTLDLVGHSFGTHLIAWSLRGLPLDEKLYVRTVILAGSVLRADHYWADLMPSRIGRVINDCGIRDNVLLASQFLVPFTGMAGRTGFVGMNGAEFMNRYSVFGHSGYFQDSAGKPADSYMRTNWLPLINSDAAPVEFDARQSPTAWRGLIIWLSNNFEPLKLMIFMLPLIIFSTFVGALYVKAEATNQRLAAVATLANDLRSKDELPAAAKPLLETINHALSSGLQRTPVLWVDDNPENNYQEQSELEKFGLCFARTKSTDEAIRLLEANPETFSIILSDFSRPNDPKAGYGLLNELHARHLDTQLIFYVSDFTEDQAQEAHAHGARAEVNSTIDLLSEVINLLPPEARAPGRMELIKQKLFGCRGLWRSPT